MLSKFKDYELAYKIFIVDLILVLICILVAVFL